MSILSTETDRVGLEPADGLSLINKDFLDEREEELGNYTIAVFDTFQLAAGAAMGAALVDDSSPSIVAEVEGRGVLLIQWRRITDAGFEIVDRRSDQSDPITGSWDSSAEPTPSP